MVKERLMTAQEVAEYLRFSVTTVRRLVLRDKIPHYRIGKMIRFRRSEIDTWLSIYRQGELLTNAKSSGFNPDQLSLFEAESRHILTQ